MTHLHQRVDEKEPQKAESPRATQGRCSLLRHLACKSKELAGLLLKTQFNRLRGVCQLSSIQDTISKQQSPHGLDSECVGAAVCVNFHLSSLQRLSGPDGICPAHPSLARIAQHHGSHRYSAVTPLFQQSGTPTFCAILHGRGSIVKRGWQ